MSVTLTPQVTLCPQCRVELAIPTIGAGQHVICAACRHRFVPQWLAVVRRVSRMAVASLILAIASLLAICLTGIPAIVLGVLALIDIRHRKGQLKGGRLAVCGIVIGAILSVPYIPVWLALGIPLMQMLRPNRGVQAVQVPSAAPAIESMPPENEESAPRIEP